MNSSSLSKPSQSPAAVPSFASVPTPPTYGFHNLDRRTILLANGSARSYFSLPEEFSFAPFVETFETLLRRLAPGLTPQFPAGVPHGPPMSTMPPRGDIPSGGGGGGGGASEFPKRKVEEKDDDSRGGVRGSKVPKRKLEEKNDGSRGGGGGSEVRKRKLKGKGDKSRGGAGGSEIRKRKLEEKDDAPCRDGGVSEVPKRKSEEKDEPASPRKNVLQHGSSDGSSMLSNHLKMGRDGVEDVAGVRVRTENVPAVVVDVDKKALQASFLQFAKIINFDLKQKAKYLQGEKDEPLKCIACSDRTSREFKHVFALISHAFNCKASQFRVDHLGLHKALCVLLGWDYMMTPTKKNMLLSMDEAQANREDLIIWPPSVIIHNSTSVRQEDGCAEGIGIKGTNTKLKELGLVGGTVIPVHCEEGHVTVVKFADTLDGLKKAEKLAEYFESDNHGRRGWTIVQASQPGDDDKNRGLVQINEKTGDKSRILYGYLATAFDLDKVGSDLKEKSVIKSRKELDTSD